MLGEQHGGCYLPSREWLVAMGGFSGRQDIDRFSLGLSSSIQKGYGCAGQHKENKQTRGFSAKTAFFYGVNQLVPGLGGPCCRRVWVKP